MIDITRIPAQAWNALGISRQFSNLFPMILCYTLLWSTDWEDHPVILYEWMMLKDYYARSFD
jgi:hypothetical protein